MAAFKRTKYESDDGTIHPLRLSPTVESQAGTEPSAAVNSNIPAKVSKGNREFGLRPRGVRLSQDVGTAPNQFTRYKFLPLRSKADYTDAAYALNATVNLGTTQNAVNWTVVAKIPEDYA